MEQKFIYVVCKSEGYYEDITITSLKAFDTEKSAKEYEERLTSVFTKAYKFYTEWNEFLNDLEDESNDYLESLSYNVFIKIAKFDVAFYIDKIPHFNI